MIKIICLGKVKEKYLQDGIDEYIKRISKYTQVKIIELEDEGIKDDKVALKKEKEKILKYLNTKDYIIAVSYTHLDVYKRQVCNSKSTILYYDSNYK